ncbi:uncharacterized protein LOC143223888 [Tachypleus tridentatus]|uniref:uncharacterized protein LOC143223888 n=1 Tax=Tachypleus tridentatus TaxID=6853 RepID=UPI003FD3E40D
MRGEHHLYKKRQRCSNHKTSIGIAKERTTSELDKETDPFNCSTPPTDKTMFKMSVCGLLLATTMLFLIVTRSVSESSSLTETNSLRRSLVEINNPADVLGVLAYLQSSILRAQEISNEKRGLDLGLSRGFSGSQAAKHRMGLAAAKFAGGPGRRRRDLSQKE